MWPAFSASLHPCTPPPRALTTPKSSTSKSRSRLTLAHLIHPSVLTAPDLCRARSRLPQAPIYSVGTQDDSPPSPSCGSVLAGEAQHCATIPAVGHGTARPGEAVRGDHETRRHAERGVQHVCLGDGPQQPGLLCTRARTQHSPSRSVPGGCAQAVHESPKGQSSWKVREPELRCAAQGLGLCVREQQ